MEPETAEILVNWTARLFTLAYVAAVLLDVAERSRSIRRTAWIVGCLLLTVHTALAFLFVHEASWAEMWRHTLSQTRERTGIATGVGVWFNLVMVAIWWLDVLGELARFNGQSSRIWRVTLQAYFAFMFFNATVVFGPWFWWPLFGLFAMAFMGLMLKFRVAARAKPAETEPPGES